MTTIGFENLKEELIKYGILLVNQYKARLKQDKTYATGRTADSIIYKTTEDELNIISALALKYIDESRGPGLPPPRSQILQWVKAKNIKPYKKGISEWYMVKKIADKIGEKGTIERFLYKGSGIIDFVYQSNKEEILSNLFAAYGRDIDLVIQDIVNRK
jgi:hypothetical protein